MIERIKGLSRSEYFEGGSIQDQGERQMSDINRLKEELKHKIFYESVFVEHLLELQRKEIDDIIEKVFGDYKLEQDK